MERVRVEVGAVGYDVVIGTDVMADAATHLPALRGAERAFVVADRGVAERWLEPLAAGLAARGLAIELLEVPAGEQAKSLTVYGALLRRLAGREAHRDDVVLALGGGAVSDLAGFVASTYMRGIRLINVPTTLTAQVDASVGGKTAVDLPEGKNLVGTFHHPVVVLCDVAPLATLHARDFGSGLAEVAKYALAIDPDLLVDLERDPAPVLARDPAQMERLVARCVAAKARVVGRDEHDRGVRLHLNYGHTLGHALERVDGFAGRTHGEAIATGMVFAARLAGERGMGDGLLGRTQQLLASLGLETSGALPPVADVMAALRMDKKWSGGLRFVLLEDVGRPVVVEGVRDVEIEPILRAMGATG